MAAILILTQHDHATLDKVTLHAVSAAQALGGEIDLLVAGQGCGPVAEAVAKVPGVRKVLQVEAEAYAQPVAEDLAALILSVADGYDYLLAASTTTGKNVMPRVAALLDTAQISDVVEVLGPDTFNRYIYASGGFSPLTPWLA